MWILVLQRLTLEALFDLVYWPVWWYTGGLVYISKKAYSIFQFGNEWLSPSIWLVNLFVPMYGQYDVAGRIISFFMRLVNVILRSFALLVWSVVSVLLCVIWILTPLIICSRIVHAL